MKVTSFAISVYDDLVKNIKISIYFKFLTYAPYLSFPKKERKSLKITVINTSKKSILRDQFKNRYFHKEDLKIHFKPSF